MRVYLDDLCYESDHAERRRSSPKHVHRIVHEEFVQKFDAKIAGPPEVYATLSEEIWRTWQRSSAGPHKGP